MTVRGPARQAVRPPSWNVDQPSVNQLWLQALTDTGRLPGDAGEATRARYRELLRLHGLLRTGEP